MSTRKYLASLDIDQLKFARDEAQRLINAYNDKEKITIWIVSDDTLNHACSLDYIEASNMLVKVASELKNKGDTEPLWLSKTRINEDELEKYMEING